MPSPLKTEISKVSNRPLAECRSKSKISVISNNGKNKLPIKKMNTKTSDSKYENIGKDLI